MTAAGTTAGAAAAPALKRNFRLNDEAHVAYINFYAADTFQQRAFQAECKSVDVKGFVIIRRLIQSQGKAGAASASGGKIDTDTGLGLVGEESLKLLAGSIGKSDHVKLQKNVLGKNRNGS